MNNTMDVWPNFFIVGAPRCGTTSLYEYLRKVEEVYLSSVKEPNYFAPSIDWNQKVSNPIRTKQEYLELFKSVKNEKAVGEASILYLWDPKTPQLIRDTIPHAKIIMILRDPIEQSFSFYLKLWSIGYEEESFRDVITKCMKLSPNDYASIILSSALYSEQVKRYLTIFNRNQIKILIFEEFINDIQKYVKCVLEFLGVNKESPEIEETIYNPFTTPRGNLSIFLLRNIKLKRLGKKFLPETLGKKLVNDYLNKKIPKPKLSADDRSILENFYREDVRKLQQLLNRSLSWSVK